jgi:hypothetical protein
VFLSFFLAVIIQEGIYPPSAVIIQGGIYPPSAVIMQGGIYSPSAVIIQANKGQNPPTQKKSVSDSNIRKKLK